MTAGSKGKDNKKPSTDKVEENKPAETKAPDATAKPDNKSATDSKPAETKTGSDKTDEKKLDKGSPAKPDSKASTATPASNPTASKTNPQAKTHGSVPPAGSASKTAKKSGGGFGLVWLILIVGIIGGGAYATLPLWKGYLSPEWQARLESFGKTATKNDTASENAPKNTSKNTGGLNDDLLARIASLETELKTVRAASGDADALKDLKDEREAINGRLTDLMSRLDSIEKQISNVQRLADTTSNQQTAFEANESLSNLSSRLSHLESNSEALNALMSRIAKLEEQGANPMAGTQALVLAIGQLREALRRPAPFVKELDGLKALAPDEAAITQAIAELGRYAPAGVLPMDDLARRFDDVANDIVAADRAMKGDGMMDTVVNRLKGLVSIRRTEGAPGGSVEAMVADADSKLEQGDLPSAVAILDGLPEASQKAATDWLTAARARLAVEKAMATLHVHAVSLLAPAKG